MNRYSHPIKSSLLLPAGVVVCGLIATVQSAFAIVGYVNVVMTNGYNFVASPLNYETNSINNVIPSAPNGTRVWLWSVTNQVFDPPATFD